MVRPRDTIVSRNAKLLVGVPRGTRVDLHLGPENSRTISDIQALVAERDQGTTRNGPSLRSRTITWLHDDSGVIRVTRGRQARRRALPRMNNSTSWPTGRCSRRRGRGRG